MTFAIRTHGLSKSLGGRRVLDRIDLSVPSGSIYGFLGPNGAGKTTAMRLLLGLLRPDAGHVELLGRPLASERIALLRQVGAFVESPALYDHLTGHANIEIARRLLGLPATEACRVLEVAGMAQAAGRKVRDYSLGMKQRLALARAMLGSPRLLLLDEPTNGLDPEGIADMRALIRALPQQAGCTVFLSSHLLSEVEQVADHAGLLRGGRLAMQGTLGDLLGHDRQVLITLDRPADALAILSAKGRTARLRGSACIEMDVPFGMPVAAASAAANAALVAAGIAVSAIAPQRRTLESLYAQTITPVQDIAA